MKIILLTDSLTKNHVVVNVKKIDAIKPIVTEESKTTMIYTTGGKIFSVDEPMVTVLEKIREV